MKIFNTLKYFNNNFKFYKNSIIVLHVTIIVNFYILHQLVAGFNQLYSLLFEFNLYIF